MKQEILRATDCTVGTVTKIDGQDCYAILFMLTDREPINIAVPLPVGQRLFKGLMARGIMTKR